jgi:hypothetical protein
MSVEHAGSPHRSNWPSLMGGIPAPVGSRRGRDLRIMIESNCRPPHQWRRPPRAANRG